MESAANAVQPLKFLPRDKKALDFILKKLTVNSSPAKYDMLAELLEMHRTCAGFNPLALTKGRFKRFRSSEIKQVLVEIEQDLNIILSSGEYLQYLEESTRHQALLEQYTNVINMLTAPPSRELNEQVDQFVIQLEQEGAYELLLSFFRQANKHFLSRSKNLEKVIETYSSLLVRADFQNSLVLSGFQTAHLLQQSMRTGNMQEKLSLHFHNLSDLLSKTGDDTNRYELLNQLIRIGLRLDNRISLIGKFTKIVTNEPGQVKLNEIGLRFELLTNAFIYDAGCEVEIKIKNLEELGEEAKKFEDREALAYIKFGIALLKAETENYDESLLLLNEAEHLLYRNGFRSQAKKAWIEICFLRFYLYIINEAVHKMIYEDSAYEIIIQMLQDSLADHSSLNDTVNGLRGIKEFVKRNHSQSLYYLEMLNVEKGFPAKHHEIIFKSLFLLLSSNAKKANKLKDELLTLNEPFYSQILGKVLKS